MKAASMFANVGIGEILLKEANINVLVANELDKKRCKFYECVFPECKMIQGDITKEEVYSEFINSCKENNIEILIATPPCQGMSTAGKMKKHDERNYLINYAIKAVNDLNPKYIMFENVPQQEKTVLYYKGKEVYIKDIIEKELSKRYNIIVDTINAADYEIAQNRKRYIFLLSRKDQKYIWKFPPKSKKVLTVRDVIGDLPSFESIPLDDGFEITCKNYGYNNGSKFKHPWHKPSKMAKRYIECMLRTPTGKSAFDNEVYYPKKLNGEKMKGFKNVFKRIEWDKPAPTVTMQNGNIGSQENGHPGRDIGNGIYSDARVLSVLEIMRIMSIPDDWRIPKWAEENFIRAVIGEGVPPLLMKKIFEELEKGVKNG